MDREEAHEAGGGCEEMTLSKSCRTGYTIGQSSGLAATGRRNVRRKRDRKESWGRSPALGTTAGSVVANESGVGIATVARVEIGNEAAALREALLSHQQTIQKLQAELEEERSASESAANEAISMILRLQQEKAEAQLEVRQFRSLTDEKMAHDQQEIATLEDELFRRDQAVQALSCEVQAYRHRLLSIGVCVDGDVLATPPYDSPRTPDSATSVRVIPQFDLHPNYRPLRCAGDVVVPELDKYPPGESPCKLDTGFFHHDSGTPGSAASCNVTDKAIVVGHSPHALPKHVRNISYGSSYGSCLDFNIDEGFPADANRAVDYDDVNDRVCTVDAVHGASEYCVSKPRELQNYRRIAPAGPDNVEIRKLYMWLQALEADRELVRRTLISMGADKARMMLMKGIPQQSCKEVTSENNMIVKKPSSSRGLSLTFIIKSIFSYVFRGSNKKPDRVKFTFGSSTVKYPRLRYQRLPMGTQAAAAWAAPTAVVLKPGICGIGFEGK